MKIFIDTAKLDEIKEAFSWGIVDGVTTNPSLIKKAVDSLKQENKPVKMGDYIVQILKTAGSKPVSLEVIGLTESEMYKQAKMLYSKFNPIARNVVVKIPVNPSVDNPKTTYDGLKVVKRLSDEGIPVNCTLIMSPEQALLVAKAGAAYASPFAGRTDDYLRAKMNDKSGKADYYPAGGGSIEGKLVEDKGIVSGVDLVSKIVQIYRNYNFKTEVIAASVRNPRQVREIALAGSHIATIPFNVLEKMLYHEKTAEGIKSFTADIVPEYRDLFS